MKNENIKDTKKKQKIRTIRKTPQKTKAIPKCFNFFWDGSVK